MMPRVTGIRGRLLVALEEGLQRGPEQSTGPKAGFVARASRSQGTFSGSPRKPHVAGEWRVLARVPASRCGSRARRV